MIPMEATLVLCYYFNPGKNISYDQEGLNHLQQLSVNNNNNISNQVQISVEFRELFLHLLFLTAPSSSCFTNWPRPEEVMNDT